MHHQHPTPSGRSERPAQPLDAFADACARFLRSASEYVDATADRHSAEAREEIGAAVRYWLAEVERAGAAVNRTSVSEILAAAWSS